MSQVSAAAASRRTFAATPAGSETQLTYAFAGERIGDVAQRVGVDEQALRQANPELTNPDFLLDGQPIQVPVDGSHLGTAVEAGVAGAMGREALVQGQMKGAYDAGRTAPQEAFDGKVFRGVSEAHTGTAYDHTWGNAPNRYRGASERLLYTSPDLGSVLNESRPYAQPGRAPLGGTVDQFGKHHPQAVVEGHYTATPNAEGKGGVANVHEGLRRNGVPAAGLADTKGPKQSGLLYRLTGEHPYTLGQQAVKGAADAGASGVRVPSATGAPEQINIIPRNTDPSQLKAERVHLFDEHGVSRGDRPATDVKPMPLNDRPPVDGPLQKGAGQRGPDAANEGAARRINEPGLARTMQKASGALEGHPRANSGRYGAVGGAVVSLAEDAVKVARGGPFDATDTVTRAGAAAGLGYTTARVADKITPKVGLKGAGGLVAGVVEGVVSTGTNAQAYRRGEVTAARATANIAVDTGTAVGAGAAGAAVGAAVGSIVPVAGTAVGAVVGFAAGTVAYMGARYIGEATGALNAAKTKLADAMSGMEKPLGQALTTIGEGCDKAKQLAGKAWDAVKFW